MLYIYIYINIYIYIISYHINRHVTYKFGWRQNKSREVSLN